MAKITKEQILDENFTNWDLAFGWGDHASEGYLASSDIDTLAELNAIIGDATLITDAPSDGSEYVRLNGAWTIASAGAEINDLTAAVVWDNVPDVNITESSVTQHEAALTITESQISDLTHTSKPSLSKSLTIPDPVATDDATIFFTPVAITITDVRSHITGTTNVVFNIGHASTRTGTQLDVFTSDITLTSTSGQSNNSGFNDATIPANSWVWLDVVSVSGTPTIFHATMIYTED